MQKLLPRERGFTLVEILVTITIVAILAVIGMVIMGAVQRNARDAKRVADINAIAKAMESNYNPANSRYNGLQAAWFAQNTVPGDPVFRQTIRSGQGTCNLSIPNTTCKYCVRTGSVLNTCFPATPTVGVNQPPAGSSWKICTNLENGSSYCKSSQQ